MSGLVRSKSDPGDYRSYQLQACPPCSCEWFREKNDGVREVCKVYQATAGNFWRTHKDQGVVHMIPATSALICTTCEDTQEELARSGHQQKLVAYDHRTGAQVLIEPDHSGGGWV